MIPERKRCIGISAERSVRNDFMDDRIAITRREAIADRVKCIAELPKTGGRFKFLAQGIETEVVRTDVDHGFGFVRPMNLSPARPLVT